MKAYLCQMKRILRRIKLVPFAILYFFFLSFYSVLSSCTNSFLLPLTPLDKGSHITLASSDLLCHAIKTESLVNALNGLPNTSLKKNLNKCSDAFKTQEQSLFNTFSQCTFYSKNVILRFHQTDIIFPFHYFW